MPNYSVMREVVIQKSIVDKLCERKERTVAQSRLTVETQPNIEMTSTNT